tara:strand:+ start:334 stop:459 length:126 start_codon:yes stop_codon:yes gene_type:complete
MFQSMLEGNKKSREIKARTIAAVVIKAENVILNIQNQLSAY